MNGPISGLAVPSPLGGKKICWAESWVVTWSLMKIVSPGEQAAGYEQQRGEHEPTSGQQRVESSAAHGGTSPFEIKAR